MLPDNQFFQGPPCKQHVLLTCFRHGPEPLLLALSSLRRDDVSVDAMAALAVESIFQHQLLQGIQVTKVRP